MKHQPQEVRTPKPHLEKQRQPEQAEHHQWTLFLKPVLVYVCSLVSPALVIGIPVLALGWSRNAVVSHSYLLATLGQALMDLPALVLFALTSFKGEWHVRLRARIISIGIGATSAAVLAGLRFALTGRLAFMGSVLAFGQSQALPPPWNVVATALAVLAYGPGEAIFVVYLVQAFDAAFGRKPRLFSWGVLITALLWALPHLANVFFFGWQWAVVINALVTAGIGLVMGVLFRGTRSAWGPITFWTLVNGTSA